MKKIGVMIFVLLFLSVSNYGYSQQPSGPMKPESKGEEAIGPGPAGPASKEGEKSQSLTPQPLPSSPGTKKETETELGEIYFTAGTISPDGQSLYVIFDRFLLQYAPQTLDLKKKVDLGIPGAPVTPSITVSKDSKKIFVIHNGMLYQIDAETFKIGNIKKIVP
jgi:hypothetical protein